MRPETDYLQVVSGLMFPESCKDRFILVLRAYFDAGQTHGQPPVLSVAGCVSTADQWIRANKNWRKVLRENDLEYFHMTDFERRHPPYDWENKRRIAVLRRLLNIITQRVRFGVAYGVDLSDYALLTAKEKEQMGRPFAYCAASCIGQIGHMLAKSRITEPVAYVFELGDKGSGEFANTMNQFTRNPKFSSDVRILSLNLEDKKKWPGLQVADILAFESCKQILRNLGIESRPTRKSFEALLAKMPWKGYYLDKQAMQARLKGEMSDWITNRCQAYFEGIPRSRGGAS